MKKINKLIILLVTAPLFLTSCIRNNGLCYCGNTKDENNDGICDSCGARIEGVCIHEDKNSDGICDICGIDIASSEGGSQGGGGGNSGSGSGGSGITTGDDDHNHGTNPCTTHVDKDMDSKCDVCGADLAIPSHTHIDSDSNGKCDICGASMIICENHVDGNIDGKCDICGADVEIPTPPVTDVTTYLVLSSVGLYNGKPGSKIPNMNLEYAVAITANAGSSLPGKTEITHLYGNADFDGWLCYEGKGAPTKYTVVPYENNKILYASFVDNGKDPVDPDTPDTPVIPSTKTTYSLRTDFMDGSDNWDVIDKQKMFVYVWKGDINNTYEMHWDSGTTWKVDIPDNTYANIIFCRLDPTVSLFDWNKVYNQTVDLQFVTGKTVAQITGWGYGEGAKSGCQWIA